MRVRLLWGAAVALSVAAGMSGPQAAAEPEAGGRVLSAPAGEAVADSYIVVLKENQVARSATDATARRLASGQRGRLGHVYTSALHGFEVSLDAAAARRLAADPAVDYVQQNRTVRLADTQVNPPNQGLDRIDQPTVPLNGSYTYPNVAADIRMYVIDTGIRATHVEFGGRVSGGASFIPGQSPTLDCNGHGTHVAGIAGGASYGVAKGVTLIPVKVFNCSRTTDTATAIAGVDWVTAHHNPGERAVANMSLSGGVNPALDAAVGRSAVDGIVYTVAAGNSGTDACGFSPGRRSGVVTVGSTSPTDGTVLPESNVGGCVSVFAPGSGILSAWIASDTAAIQMRGTSQAAPFAAGVAAMIWSMHPTRLAYQITEDVAHIAAQGVIPNYTAGPNRHVFVPQIVVSGLSTFGGMFGDVIINHLAAGGGTAPYTWSATGLPGGIDPNTGVLSALPVPGVYTVTVTARDALGRTGSSTATWFVPVPCAIEC
jgi:subtilisin family serine protease